MTINAVIRLLRPRQWAKNLFVFAPLIFARELFIAEHAFQTVRAFIVFCLTASMIYIINDITDVASDRAHPEKRHRPLASGELSTRQAVFIIFALAVLDAALLWGMHRTFIMLVATYLVMNVAYSLVLKDVMLLDVFVIAGGFMLRVLGGAYAIEVVVSNWLVLCSLFISLFLGFAKRRGEIVLTNPTGVAGERKVLKMYSVTLLDQMLTITAAATIISYAMYTVAPRTIEVFGTDKLIYTTVFVIYGVFRYLHLVQTTVSVENPTNAVTTDFPIIVAALLWILSCVVLIYYRHNLPNLMGMLTREAFPFLPFLS